MTREEIDDAVKQLKQFAKRWNELYAGHRFEDMKDLATEDVGIANAQKSKQSTGLIYGRQEYFNGIYEAYRGSTGKEHNLLVMEYETWEYVPLGENQFYTIGKYTLQPNVVGVNCWLLRRDSHNEPWRIFRVINN